MIDWKSDIARMAHWKQVAAEHDESNILPWHLPRIAASDDAISAAELASGIKFPDDLKDFLRHADGWEGFHIDTDLFGTPEFLSGKAKDVCRRIELASHMQAIGFAPEDYAAIGSSKFSLEVFILISQKASRLRGGVIWFVSEEIDRYSSFYEFFLSMTAYNERIAAKMKDNFR